MLLLDQNRALWDRLLIRRGLAALDRARALGGSTGPYALQAAIAACHARAATADATNWVEIADLYGQLAAVLPSPIVELNRAVAVGMAQGMGLGDNTKATIVTRGLAETARLGEALGADPATFSGLAGVGDLIATCMSPLSRNHTFGEQLGRGRSVAEVVAATRQTAEGVKSCQSILDLARAHDVDMPITEGVVAVVALEQVE